MPSPLLPLDLLRHIISEIPLRRDLRSLAMVSKPFREEAQRALFFNPNLGQKCIQHFKFLDAIIESPDRLALLVNTYSQVYVPCINWEVTRDPFKALTCLALQCMKNLKHLEYRCWDESPSARILQGCDFKLLSFRWGCRSDERALVLDFLPSQTDLKHLTLREMSTANELWADWNFLETATRSCPNLTSLCGPKETIDLFLFGRALTHLQWYPDDGDNADEVIKIFSSEFNCLKYLTYGIMDEMLPLESVVGNIRSIVLLEVPYCDREVNTHSDYTVIFLTIHSIGLSHTTRPSEIARRYICYI